MKDVVTSKNFLTIEMTAKEAYDKGFGIEGGIVCADCNGLFEGDNKVIYVACINDFMCENCFHQWHKDATYYPEDAEYEGYNIDMVHRAFANEHSHKIEIYSF